VNLSLSMTNWKYCTSPLKYNSEEGRIVKPAGNSIVINPAASDNFSEQATQAMWIGFAHRICDLYFRGEIDTFQANL